MKKQDFKSPAEQRTLVCSEGAMPYLLTRKNVKNINLRVKQNGTVTVSAHPRVPLARIEAFLLAQRPFIARAKENLAKKTPVPHLLLDGEQLPFGGVLHTVCLQCGKKAGGTLQEGKLILTVTDPADFAARKRAFDKFLDAHAKETLTAATARLAPLFTPTVSSTPQLRFRTMKSKWGVCYPRRGSITLNRNLAYLPPSLADYVICHELAHFCHADHSPAFWQCLTVRIPDCKTKRQQLNLFEIPKFWED